MTAADPAYQAHDRWRDVAAAAAVFGFGLLLSLLVPQSRITWQPEAPPAHLFSVLAIAVAAVGTAQRRVRPLLGALGCLAAIMASLLVAGYLDPAVVLIAADLMFCLVRYGSARLSRIVLFGVAAVAALAVLGALVLGGLTPALQVALLVLAPVTPVWWGWDVRQHWLRAVRASERAARARQSAVTAERARMARELHDSVAGQLSVIALQSEAALNLTDADPEVLRRILTAVRENSVASLADMRSMIGLLRSGEDEFTEAARPAPVDRLVEDARASGLRVELSDERAGQPHTGALQLGTSRIVQEALTNAAKHAPGSTVRVALRERERELVIEVTNELVHGAPEGGGTGIGLLSLRERAQAAGGSIEAGRRGQRWCLRAVLPREPVTSG